MLLLVERLVQEGGNWFWLSRRGCDDVQWLARSAAASVDTQNEDSRTGNGIPHVRVINVVSGSHPAMSADVTLEFRYDTSVGK